MDKAEIIKAIEIKGKNKRFLIIWYKNDSIGFQTKTLQDWKQRIITKTSGIYSLDSFIVLTELFTQIYNDPEFVKLTNPLRGQLNKNKLQAIVYK